MADVEGQRSLVEIAPSHLDAGGFAAQRLPAVGADHQPGLQRFARAGGDDDSRFVRDDGHRLVVQSREVRQLGCALFQCVDQCAVVDIVAELVEANLLGDEADLRRPDQVASVVDQPHHPQRRGSFATAWPDVEPLQQVDGGAQQRCGAVVRIGRAAGKQGDCRPGLRERNSGHEPGGAAADNDCVKRHGSIIHDRDN